MNNTVDIMLCAADEIWKKYNEHPFVCGIENGTLERERFRYYVIQDYLYLEEYAKVFAIGLAKAKSENTAALFAKYISIIHGKEMDIHHGYMGKLGITRDELNAVKRAIDNISYTSYMLRVAYEEGEAEILAAILSCAYSYEVIAENILKRNPAAAENSFYGEWICGYASEEYKSENVELINMLGELTQSYTKEQIEHLCEIFVLCSRYELAFWEIAWNMSK